MCTPPYPGPDVAGIGIVSVDGGITGEGVAHLAIDKLLFVPVPKE